LFSAFNNAYEARDKEELSLCGFNALDILVGFKDLESTADVKALFKSLRSIRETAALISHGADAHLIEEAYANVDVKAACEATERLQSVAVSA
jgi:hypothetical protein